MTLKVKGLKSLATLLAAILLLGGSYAVYELLTGNVHRLDGGRIYRSGQLSATQIRHLASSHGIRSVLNLRGASRGEWYRDETNVCAELSLQHADLKLSARSRLTEEQMDQLAVILRNLPKPLLIHCTGGADRTSLACAIYRYDVLGEKAEDAAGELGVLYGHIPYFHWRYSIAMDRSFWEHVKVHSLSGRPS